jgi:hypothetical protein
MATLMGASEPVPLITLEAQSTETGCAVVFEIAVSVVFPPGPDGLVDTVTITYTYDVSEVDGVVTGTGDVHASTITNTGVVKVDCTENLALGGTFSPGN